MLTKNQKKWIAALRSGEYKQGQHKLQTDTNSFCCLGVVCKVFEKETGDKLPTSPHGIIEGGSLLGYDQVKTWVGLRHYSGRGLSYDTPALTILNDSGASFDKIADILENSPEEYFAQEDDDE